MPSNKKHTRPINRKKTLEPYSKLPSKALENAAKKSSKALIPISTNNPMIGEGNLQLAAEGEAINTTRYFCTIASKDYFIKVLTLYFSLRRNCKSFHLWICAVDDITYYTILSMHLKNITILPLSKLEDKELLAVKSSRKLNEYCWTLKAPLIQYILNNYRVEAIIYCDGDLFFFSDPEPIFSEWDGYSILLCPQRDLDWVHDKYGFYQAGLIGFKKDKNSLDSLSWWRAKCIEWCLSEPEPEMERFGDQKYLDKFPLLFQSIKVSENLGVDAAPWNSIYNNNYNIYKKNENIFIEKDKLISYHFACVTIFNEREFDLWTFDKLSISEVIKSNIYLQYFNTIRKLIKYLNHKYGDIVKIFFSDKNVNEAKTYFRYSPLGITMAHYDQFYNFCTLVSREYLIKCLTLYNSLNRRISNFHIWICCVDNITFDTLSRLRLEHVTLIHVNKIEDSELLAVKENRTLTEYCWTLKAPLISYLLKSYRLESVVYLDADLYFFSAPQIIFDQWKEYSFFMCPQRDNEEFEKVHGQFQAGLLGFSNDKYSWDILNWWKNKCIEWCSNQIEPTTERWGDQKYLDKLPTQFESIKLINNLGINAAPWNLIINNNYKVHKDGEEIFIENDKLVVYHFGSMKIFNEFQFDLWKLNTLAFNDDIINNIYIPYIDDLKSIISKLRLMKKMNIGRFFNSGRPQDAKNPFVH